MDTLGLGIVSLRGASEHAEDETAVPGGVPAEMVRLVRAGRTPGELSREFEAVGPDDS